MLFSGRKRQEELAARESRGESFWTDQFDNQARTRILHVAEDAAGSSPRRYYVLARALILRNEGLLYLAESWYDERQDLLNYLLNTDSEKP